MLGETALQGPTTSILEYLSERDRERIKEAKQASEQQIQVQAVPQQPQPSRFQSASADNTPKRWQVALGEQLSMASSSDFKPFANYPEKQKRYEHYIYSLKQGQKVEALENCLDPNMTEWEQGREQEEFFRAASFYKSSNPVLSSRFIHAKHEDDTDKTEVPRDQENDIDDKEAAVKMKMFGKLTRDKFEWHPEKVLCKRFNIPDPYSDSSIVGLPKVKRYKYSVFNFLTIPVSATTSLTQPTNETTQQNNASSKSKKPSRWDVSDKEKKKKDSISEFISLARSKVDQHQPEPTIKKDTSKINEPLLNKAISESTYQKEEEEEETRPSMDLFKAIFASFSDEKSSSSEEESDEEENKVTAVVPDSESTKHPDLPDSESTKHPDPPDVSSSDVQEIKAFTTEPALPVLSSLKEEVDVREEFGPRLPPVLSSDTTQKFEPVQLTSSPEATQKEKPKKSREKHKTKREHRHKKEKKKKHKKHKHKGKHKNKKVEKNSSSDTADSTDSHNDVEETTDLSPQELLRRLKHLPVMKH
uniref:G patch domain-containing protein 1 n=1 Tax=Sphenodon punctatus TaxID=8508 RepID=A0A8D0HAG1_SPHPU